jgi:integrase
MQQWRTEAPRKRENPSGTVVWRARVRNAETGERREVGTRRTRAEAKDFAQQWCRSQERVVALDRMTVASYFDYWKREWPRPSERTNEGNWHRVGHYVLPVIGDMYVDELRPKHLKALCGQLMERGLAAVMIRNVLRSLSAVLSDAVQDEVTEINPAFRFRFNANDPRIRAKRPRRRRILTYDLMLELADAAPEPYGGAVLFPGASGARPAEVFARLHSDLDRHALQIHIATTAYDGEIEPGTKADHGEPESRQGRWSIVTPELLAYIDSAPRSVTGLVWPTPRGRVWRYDNFQRDVWRPARRRAGLSEVPIYDLRHSFISLMQEEGGRSPTSLRPRGTSGSPRSRTSTRTRSAAHTTACAPLSQARRRIRDATTLIGSATALWPERSCGRECSNHGLPALWFGTRLQLREPADRSWASL